jgi:hypothetical protein
MSAHAKFSPSSASRWIECPHSALLAATLPNPESAESAEGTRVHALLDSAFKGEPVHDDESEDVAYSVELVLDFVKKLRGPEYIKHETKVTLSEDVWGTADVVQTSPVIATVLDYKNGAMDVEAYQNKQLLTYAAAVLEQYGPSRHYRLVIVQPWSRTAGYQPEVKQWVATLEQVEEHREKVLEAVRRGLAGEGPQPGRHCRWCAAFGNCGATREMLPFIMTAVSMMPSEVPNETAVRMLRVLRGLEDFRKNLEKDVMKRFAAGAQIPDATIGVTQTHRKWADDRMAVEKLMAAFGLTGVDPVSPATAEKMGALGKEIARTLAYKPPGQPKITY